MTDKDNGVNGICLRGKARLGGQAGAFITAMANSFRRTAGLTKDRNACSWTREMWADAVNFYKNMMPDGQRRPCGIRDGNGFNEILALYNEGKCGLWIDATIAASFLSVDGVAYAQSPNAGNAVGANWLWAWAMAVPAGSPNAEAAMAFIEWATSKDYVQAVGNHPDFGWGSVPTGQRASTYAIR